MSTEQQPIEVKDKLDLDSALDQRVGELRRVPRNPIEEEKWEYDDLLHNMRQASSDHKHIVKKIQRQCEFMAPNFTLLPSEKRDSYSVIVENRVIATVSRTVFLSVVETKERVDDAEYALETYVSALQRKCGVFATYQLDEDYTWVKSNKEKVVKESKSNGKK